MAAPGAYALLDATRRHAGRVLDATGFGPIETPSRIIAATPGARLRAYQPPEANPRRPSLLILPAPIKRAYLWDLLPPVSVVRRCLSDGLRVHLVEWLDPEAAQDRFGLADYAERIPLAALDAIAAETGEDAAILAGHSLGGTFAAILAALRPERVRGLVLVDAPLAFGPEHGGPLARSVTAGPHARHLRRLAGSPVPGSFVAQLAAAAAPDAFVLERWADLGAGLVDPRALAIRARVERWLLDEFAMPGQLFEDVLERLYREDRLEKGTLEIGGRRVGLDRLRCPVLAVVNPSGHVVPPESVLAGLAALPPDLPRRVLRHARTERGAALQHLGPLVGPSAHAELWPQILAWIRACWSASSAARERSARPSCDPPPRPVPDAVRREVPPRGSRRATRPTRSSARRPKAR